MEAILHLDWQILSAIEKLHCSLLDFLMPKLTLLGNYGILWIVLALVLLCIPKTRTCGCALAIALVLALLLGNCLFKPLIARLRPFAQNPAIVLLIPSPGDFSFPSGHTYSGIASALVIWHNNRKWGIVAMAVALGIAFSRLYLMVHFPTDILGGILLGALCAILAIQITKRYRS
ncbi:MAG: phosphatase PAP2 family protein [Clostridia bacterium]|nr:phosphatase PAP2 family protein [Clostridia bacterium]